MEIGKHNILSEHEIEAVLRDHPDDGWDLLQQGRIEPATLEVVPEAEASPDLRKVKHIGHVAEQGADVQQSWAA